MMGRENINQRYGSLGGPESISEPHRSDAYLQEDAIQTLGSAYQLFRKTMETLRTGEDSGRSSPNTEIEYQEACRLLKGFYWISSGEGVADHIIELGNRNQYEGAGIFLSAVLNSTSIDELVIRGGDVDNIGYRLGKGKRLILGRDVRADSAAHSSSGDIFSWGTVRWLGLNAEGGFQCNMGSTNYMAFCANGGLQINMKEIDVLGYEAGSGSTQINCGEPGVFRGSSYSGTCNNAKLSGRIYEEMAGKRTIATGCNVFLPDTRIVSVSNRNLTNSPDKDICSRLYLKLSELDFLNTKDFDSGTPEKIRKLDTKSLAAEISGIAAKIREYAIQLYMEDK